MKVGPIRLAEILARLQALGAVWSLGPVRQERSPMADEIRPCARVNGLRVVDFGSALELPDATFIAHSREDVRDLVAELQRARAQLASLGHDEHCPWVRGEREICYCTDDE